MTGLEKTLKSLNATKKSLSDMIDESHKSGWSIGYHKAIQFSVALLDKDIEMVEFRITQEQTK